MAGGAQLAVEMGPDRGRVFTLPAGGSARIGRSHGNDMALHDPLVSRFHFRLFFKPSGELWISDLGSSNETLVNNAPVREKQLRDGDRIAVGDSLMVVRLAPADAVAGPAVDLGLGAPAQPERKVGGNRRSRILLLCVAAAVAGGAVLFVWLPKLRQADGAPKPAAVPAPAPAKVDIRFEKVSGTASNIYRFCLNIADGKAAIEVDDLLNNRHFKKPMTPVNAEALAGLADSLKGSSFFDLEEEYSREQAGAYELRDLFVSVGAQSRRVKVLNSTEPPPFESAARMVEEFGINEFGIRSLSRPPEELIALARESLILGRKLRDEQNVSYENLFLAVSKLKEAEVYLETIEPKPDFYAGIVTDRGKFETELSRVYNDLRFEADKAIKLKNWAEAARILQIICATIPDKSHEWHKQAEQQLLDVQKRVER